MSDDIIQLSQRVAGGIEFLNYFNYGGEEVSLTGILWLPQSNLILRVQRPRTGASMATLLLLI